MFQISNHNVNAFTNCKLNHSILQNLQDNQIRRLRFKYGTAILSSPANELREPIMKEAEDLYKKAADKKIFEMVKSRSSKPQPPQQKEKETSSTKKTVKFARNLATIFEDVACQSEEEN